MVLCLLVALPAISIGQYLTAKDSDPEALKLLEKASAPYATGNVQMDYTLKVAFPGEEPISTPGKLYKSGKSYHVDVKDYTIMSDGKTRWVFMKAANEVNIYNESEKDDWIDPQDFLNLHQAQDLVFISAGAKGDGIQAIEAKPLKGRFEDYSKFNIQLKNGKLHSIIALSKDGMRQELNIHSITQPASLDQQKLFTFQASRYPGVHVEDLRID